MGSNLKLTEGSHIYLDSRKSKRESDKPVTRRYLYLWICLGLNSHDVTDISFIVITHKKKKITNLSLLTPMLFCSSNYSCFKIKPSRQVQRKCVLIFKKYIIFIITKVKKITTSVHNIFIKSFPPFLHRKTFLNFLHFYISTGNFLTTNS